MPVGLYVCVRVFVGCVGVCVCYVLCVACCMLCVLCCVCAKSLTETPIASARFPQLRSGLRESDLANT